MKSTNFLIIHLSDLKHTYNFRFQNWTVPHADFDLLSYFQAIFIQFKTYIHFCFLWWPLHIVRLSYLSCYIHQIWNKRKRTYLLPELKFVTCWLWPWRTHLHFYLLSHIHNALIIVMYFFGSEQSGTFSWFWPADLLAYFIASKVEWCPLLTLTLIYWTSFLFI